MKCRRPLAMGLWLALVLAAAALPTRPGAAQTAVISVELDANPAGNGPRTVGTIDACARGDVGQPLDVDVVVPSPGVPASLGITGYQFTFVYDPQMLSVTGQDYKLLMDQAAGSSLLDFSDALPNTSGEYLTVVVDFGSLGIEPAGSSEIGDGVISRLTLLPQRQGASFVRLRDVRLVDDSGGEVPVEIGQPATVAVGRTCEGPTPSPEPTPAPTAKPEGGALPDAGPAATADGGVPRAGGPPPAAGNPGLWLVIAGLVAVVAGGGMAMGGFASGAAIRTARSIGSGRRDWRPPGNKRD